MARQSSFVKQGFKKIIAELVEEIKTMYHADSFPWVVGYSGGKDSTATLQLIWYALESMEPAERNKPVHVISTDTLVENPIVASWVTQSLQTMAGTARTKGLPIEPHRLTPTVKDSFWVNLIGKGYPAPRPKFRWCTERLKINPSNTFIREMVKENGEAILVLGTRKAESSSRHSNMERYEKKRLRDKLSPNAKLPNCLIYSPIEEWTNDDVWTYLMQEKNPWGYNNKDLLTMYQGASADGECPLVVDSDTPSCGDSRFGCWVCTLVDQDRSMTAMIQNDEEKEWMFPLLELRNKLDHRSHGLEQGDRHLRDFRRMKGTVQVFNERVIPGPYKQEVRADWLRKLLEAQRWVRENGPEEVQDLELISIAELHEIRRIWVIEKHEFEDQLPRTFQDVTGEVFPGKNLDDNLPFCIEDLAVLREICGEDELSYQLARELIDIERRFRGKAKRSGLFKELETAFTKHFYTDQEDALDLALRRSEAKKKIENNQKTVVQVAVG